MSVYMSIALISLYLYNSDYVYLNTLYRYISRILSRVFVLLLTSIPIYYITLFNLFAINSNCRAIAFKGYPYSVSYL